MARYDSSTSLLYCPSALTDNKSLYIEARKAVYADSGLMPKVVSETTDISDLPPDAIFYYPIMTASRHWWLNLVGADNVRMVDKISVSADCQLAVIRNVCPDAELKKQGAKNLSVGEVNLASAFFKVVSKKLGCVQDMVATSAGSVMILFQGLSEKKLSDALLDTGNKYYGIIGSY
ncbi:MAG: hypothetical protein LBB23_03940 [Rickettsiales bacterium]|jgi:hypothetical protein|nr:hypothetical protein [Rickettsiales bacterium]